MLKARKKSLSLLVTLAFLFTMILPGVAFGAAEYVKVSSSYTYVDAEDAQTVGEIFITAGEDYASSVDAVYAEVTLPDGVEFTDTDAITGVGIVEVIGSTDTSCVCELNEVIFSGADQSVILDLGTLDIESDVSGDIDVAVRVWGTAGNAIVFDETFNTTVAKVASGDVTVSAASAKTLTVGSNKTGAKITIKELGPGALGISDGGDIFLTVKASGVKWDTTNMTDPSVMGLTLDPIDPANDYSNSDKTLHLVVTEASTTMKGKIEITPVLVVQPGASGDVVIQVKGDDIDSTDVTVGTVGASTVDVTVDKDNKDKVYIGRIADFDDVKVTLDPTTMFKQDDYFTVTLPAGLKFQDPEELDSATPITVSSPDTVSFVGLYNNDRSAWFSFTDNESSDIELTHFMVLADYNAKPGDLEITFGGVVAGTYKIGTVAEQFEITCEPVTVEVNSAGAAGNKIVITETAAGAILEGATLDIALPMGLTFASTPDVDVVDGDLELGTVEVVDDDTLHIQITQKSNLASTIEITEISYNVDGRAAIGDAVAKVGKELNENSNNPLAKVKVAKVVTPATILESVFVIGSSTYTVDGVEKTMDVVPYIKGDRTYLPIRYVAYALGIDDSNILWDGTNQTVTLMKGDKVVQLQIGSKDLMINGATITMDVAPEITNDRTMLPIRFVAQAFGATVSWDAATQTVTIE